MMKIDNGVYTLNTSFTTKKQADLIKNLVKKEISASFPYGGLYVFIV